MLLDVGRGAADLVQLWIAVAAGNAEQGTALQDAQARDAQRRILASRRLDESVQHRFVEQLRPEAQVGLGLLLRLPDLAVQVGMPVVEPRDIRLLVVGAERDACESASTAANRKGPTTRFIRGRIRRRATMRARGLSAAAASTHSAPSRIPGSSTHSMNNW